MKHEFRYHNQSCFEGPIGTTFQSDNTHPSLNIWMGKSDTPMKFKLQVEVSYPLMVSVLVWAIHLRTLL